MFDYDQLTRRWWEEVWNQQRAEVIEELMAPDAVGHGLGDSAEGVQGRAEFKELHTRFCGAFPDLRIEVGDVIVDGDRSAARLTVTGTHHGDHLGFAATGRPVRFSGIVFTRWQEGQLAEGWNEFNFASMMEQLQAPG
jgi:steroid delta-isomerase-like uncharacterized protein